MKGGHSSRSWGRQSSFTVAALFFTTILLWSWENNPLLTSLLSAQEQFLMHTTDFTVDPFADPSVSTNPSGEQEQGLSQFPEGTEDDDTIKPFEIDTSLMNMPHHEGRDQNKVSVSSLEKKVLTNPLGEQDQGSVSQLPEGTEDDDTVKPFEIDTSLMNMPRHEGRDQNKVSVSSLEKKDPLGEQEQGSVSQFHEGTEDDDTVKPFESDTSSMNMPHHEGRDKKKVSVSSLEKKGRDKNKVSVSSLKKACNYGKGRWVADSRRPLYSGFGCKQWLSDMWACRLTQRKDFSYENYRWQPNDCEMPEFQGSKFLRRMQDKTIAFIGDSLGRQQFQSLMCMASGGEEMPEVESVEWKYGLSKPKGAIRPDGWAYRFPSTNTTILYYWSASLCGIEPINITDPATEYAMHLDRPPAFLERYLPQFDVVILNTGHHWNRGKLRANRWVMYADGKPVTNRKLAEMGNAKNHTLHSIARWLDSQIPLHPGIKVFLRTISPRHFSNGEWNTGGSCDNISPLLKGSEVLQNQSSDPVAEAAARGTKVKLLDITALSELRDESHLSHYSKKASVGINDCLHWCLPGIPDTWNELFYAQL